MGHKGNRQGISRIGESQKIDGKDERSRTAK